MNNLTQIFTRTKNVLTKLVRNALGEIGDDKTQTIFVTGTVVSLGLGICLAVFIGSTINSNRPLTGVEGEVPMVKLVNRFGDTHTLKLEIARTAEQQRKGLMFRTFLPSDQGMLFVFDSEAPREFWMQNTLISLDIIFADANGKVVTIHKRTKTNQTTETYPSSQPAKFVLETNGGWADQSQLVVGDRLEFLQ
jgi:uncharacterized membrane protein (UPF0127 family)